MRRIVLLVVVAVLGATWFGVSSFSSGVNINSHPISSVTLRNELSVIAHTPTLQCYLEAVDPVNFGVAGGGDSVSAAGAAEWTRLRLEGVALSNYVKGHFTFRPTAAQLTSAKLALESQMLQSASSANYSCPGTPQTAVAAMPAEMRDAEVEGQAMSSFLMNKLSTTIPLTTAGLQKYFSAHQANYDTLCISIALINPSSLSAFQKDQAAGMSVANLAKKYSMDASGASGGTYGCYSPTSSSYTNVRSDVSGLALNTFSTSPIPISQNNAEYYLFVAVTKKTPNTFTAVAAHVASDVQAANAQQAAAATEKILYLSNISIDPSLGRWALSSSGPEVLKPAIPSTKWVTGATSLVSAGATYR